MADQRSGHPRQATRSRHESQAATVLRPGIRVVIKLADDASESGLGLAEVIAAVAVAAKTPGLAQFVDRAGDFAAVLAAERFDDVGVEHRTRAERLLDGLIAGRALEHLGGAARERQLAVAAERSGAVEAGFGAGAPAVQRWVHGHPHHAL